MSRRPIHDTHRKAALRLQQVTSQLSHNFAAQSKLEQELDDVDMQLQGVHAQRAHIVETMEANAIGKYDL